MTSSQLFECAHERSGGYRPAACRIRGHHYEEEEGHRKDYRARRGRGGGGGARRVTSLASEHFPHQCELLGQDFTGYVIFFFFPSCEYFANFTNILRTFYEYFTNILRILNIIDIINIFEYLKYFRIFLNIFEYF